MDLEAAEWSCEDFWHITCLNNMCRGLSSNTSQTQRYEFPMSLIRVRITLYLFYIVNARRGQVWTVYRKLKLGSHHPRLEFGDPHN